MDLGKYRQVPYATLIRLTFGSPPDTSRIRKKLTEHHILNVLPDGNASQRARFAATPAQSGVSESVAFQPLVEIISTLFNQIPSCQVSFAANPSATPFSERRNASRPHAHIVYPANNKTYWLDIAIPCLRRPKIVAQSMTYVANGFLKLCWTNAIASERAKDDMGSAPHYARGSPSPLCLGNHDRGHGPETLV